MPGIRNLTGKTAVVTGGANGIGAGLCRQFVREGMRVVVADVDAAAASETAKALCDAGGEAVSFACDVTDRQAVQALLAASLDAFGRVDVLCNNAGVFLGGNMRDFTEGDWNWVMSVNLMGVVNGASVFVPHLIAQGSGHIVNTASVGGFAPSSECAPYTASKFAVVGYSGALRMDLASDGVGVTTLCPGPVKTNIDECDRLRPASAGTSATTSKAAIPVIENGMSPDRVGELVVDGIRQDAVYVFTHPEFGPFFETRFDEVRKAIAASPPSTQTSRD